MTDDLILRITDWLIKPREWYHYTELSLAGFSFIGAKEDEKYAGYIREKDHSREKKRSFGLNPIKPYRDYYGNFKLKTRLYPDEITVSFAIGYTINQKVVTVDDYSNFSWLRLATGLTGMIYPNLSHQKQLLEWLILNSKAPRFIIARVYHYLVFDLYQELTAEIMKQQEQINS